MKKRLLIVDDVDMNRQLLAEMLEDNYIIHEATDGGEAIAFMADHYKEITVVLLDLIMPTVDGYDVLKTFAEKKWLDTCCVIVISGEQEATSEQTCFEMGAIDFIRKPFNTSIVRRRVDNAAQLISYKNQLEEKVEKQTKSLTQYARKLNKMNEKVIDVLGSVVESRDLESGEHIFRVKGYTTILAKEIMKRYPEYRLTDRKVQLIASASALHDVGKIAIPDSILLKPGKLDPDEYEIMKTHSTLGFELLDKVKYVWDEEYAGTCSAIARYHHERYDGGGYPDGLVGDEIPIAAQLVSLADVYDALVNERCYKRPFSKEQAYNMILNGDCGAFSPKLLDCFSKSRKKFEKIAERQMANSSY